MTTSPEDAAGLSPLSLVATLAEATGGTAELGDSFGRPVATVPAEHWIAALTALRDRGGAAFFDWLTAVDELENGYTVAAFVCAAEGPDRGRGVLVKTRLPRENPRLASATGVYRGANWHERETFEMFGIEFTGHPDLKPLLLPDGFEGHPLRKDFVLASRVAKAWPGAKEPGESEHAAASPGRRRMLPPGVPGEEWLKPYRPETDAADTGSGSDDAGSDIKTAEPPGAAE